jgi:hypothetical protein
MNEDKRTGRMFIRPYKTQRKTITKKFANRVIGSANLQVRNVFLVLVIENNAPSGESVAEIRLISRPGRSALHNENKARISYFFDIRYIFAPTKTEENKS